MQYQPPHPNPSLPNKHELYLGMTGSGKSQALAQNKAIPSAGGNVILWDQAGDHAGVHYSNRADFLAAVVRGVQAGRGFRIAFAGEQSVENYEWWWQVVWSVLDGKRQTWAIVEELAAVCPSSGRATPNAAFALNQGRKYGLIFHGASQRPADVAKTYYDNCNTRWIGQQRSPALQRRFAEDLGITPGEVAALEPLQFYRDTGAAVPELVTLQYRKKVGVTWK
jgi:DNA helicase HerA-like ATPase